MDNMTFIIPLNKFDNEVETYLEKSIKSIKDNVNTKKSTIMFVGPTDVINKAAIICSTLKCKHTVSLVENNDTDFCNQINKAAMQCLTPYFTIVEFDDELYPYWISKVEKYINTEYSASLYMPLTELTNTDGKMLSFANEIALSNSFTNEQGIIDIECLETFMDFNVTGSVIKTESFISIGGLKPSLKLVALYEFLLRMCHNELIVRVVPFVGYKHTIGRQNSYTETIAKNMDTEYVKWLIKTAQQEYFFKEDRNIEYKKED